MEFVGGKQNQFSVEHEMWKLGSWQMCKNKVSQHRLATNFVCSGCWGITERMMVTIKKLCYEGDSGWMMLFGRQAKSQWWLSSGSHSKSTNWLRQIQEMWKVVTCKQVSAADERQSLSLLCKISITTRK